ncbi:MAG: tetratricopeptide repeat protein [Solirubrobacteraceae bacterium]
MSVVAAQAPGILLALVPGALTVYFGFRAGGFFAGTTAWVAALLLLLLAARVLTVARPAEGINRGVALAVAGLALFALWTLISSRWSQAPGRALIEFDRALLYTSALVVFGAVGMERRRLQWMVRGIALAALIVCGSGLITRLLPEVWPLMQVSISPRLSYPVTYWNAFGVLAAIGIIFCFGLTSSDREPWPVRILAAAATPVLASALLLTLSRGGVATAAIGVLVFAVVGHPRALLTGLLAVVPATAIALSSTYGADLLVTADALTSAGQAQGRDVATVVALCAVGAGLVRALLLYADHIVIRLRPSASARRLVLGTAATALVVAGVVIAVAVDAPGQYEAFVTSGASNTPSTATPGTDDPRDRLTTITDNGRIGLWAVAIDEFERQPLHGTGAGTFEHSWDIHRTTTLTVIDGHSLYAEVLGELGLVGLALLLVVLVTIIVGVAWRIRGADRALYATIFAAIVAWAVAAGFDWHWEMPVVTLWVFALGGAAIAGARDRVPATRFLGMLPRSVIAIACCALLVLVPARLIISQDRLESTLVAYQEERCNEVSVLAEQSLDAVPSRPEPRELTAACQLRAGQATQAISTLRAAVQRDPDSWRLHYSLAAVQARAGEDPRPEIRRALRLNPLLVQEAAEGLERADGPEEWREAALDLNLQVLIPKV